MDSPSPQGIVALAVEELLPWREALRLSGARLIMTNGCFDLLHVGHLRYLSQARALGDALVLALNDDASVRRLKGPGRPVLPWADRAELLAGLRVVDAVLGFAEDTAVVALRRLQPDVYVKGGDYGPANWPPEADEARALGAEVRFLGLAPGRSTSAILKQLRDAGPG
ncbi:MAG TPA: adenylyltransferase/cytidyltransferase family protein [Anaerolineae bacterium]|nr:adenylyltransferase/cytidyltransferase family protein [Anaerolineae bacterium]